MISRQAAGSGRRAPGGRLGAAGYGLPALLIMAACATIVGSPQLDIAPRPLDALHRLQADLTAAVADMPGVRRGTWGISVQSLATSERLFELNPNTLIVPASVEKLVSAATAADAVGWDYQFTTTLRATGPIEDGVLHGDLLIDGGGDPSIGGHGGEDLSSWVSALKTAGIHRIDGRIVGVDDLFEEPRPGFGWAWDDLGYRTGAIFGALNLAENSITVTVTPGTTVGAAALLTATGDGRDVQTIDRVTTGAAGSRQLLWPEMRPGETEVTIAGSVALGARPSSLAVSAGNPTVWFARVLRRRVIAAGIEVMGEAVDGDDLDPPLHADDAAILFTYRSHPLGAIAQPMLKESINLYGEAFERLNAEGPLPHTNDQALDGMKRRLLSWGIPADGFQLVDGSGLSRRDVIAPDTLLRILVRMYDAAGESPWMTALPIAGVDGTLAARMKGTPADNNVRAKTGTMSNVRSLAGYVKTRDGEPLAFVVMLENFEGTGAEAVAAIDSIAVRLASFKR